MCYDINGIVGIRGDIVSFKRLLIILSFAVTVLIVILLGTSYAWYTFDNAVTSFNNVQTFSDNIDTAVVFTNSSNIGTTVGIPILASDVEERSEKTIFTVTPSTTLSGREVAFQISLIDLKIDSALTGVSSLKYSLLQTVDGTTTTIKSGNFSGVTADSLILSTTTVPSANLGKTYSYEFRLWLEEDNSNQNALMGKKLEGYIKVNTAIR